MTDQKKQEMLKKVKTYLYEDPLTSPPEKILEQKNRNKSLRVEQQLHKEVSAGSEIKSIDEWELLKQKAHGCHLCSLSRSRANVVFGYGNPKSMLYIIGEAPGGEEDLQGVPFVGRSGKLLSKMLSAIGIDREEVFITNIIKCRPPSNRDPLPAEIESCSPYLKEQLRLGDPKVILALGRYSGTFLVGNPKATLGSLRGSLHDTSYGRVFVTYHPSAVLRSPVQRRPDVWEDLKVLARYLYKEGFYTSSDKKDLLIKNQVFDHKEL